MGPHSAEEDKLNSDTVVNNKEFFNVQGILPSTFVNHCGLHT